MNEEQKRLAEKILKALELRHFDDWYNGNRFDDYITGTYRVDDPRCPTKDQILADIVRLFNL